MLCSEISLVKLADQGEEINPLPCNRWSCAHCGPRRRAKLLKLATAGAPNRCLTLTANPSTGKNAEHRREMLHDAWKRLTKRIMRHHRWKKLHYMAFVEKTEAGEPHLHILLRSGFIGQRWLSTQMKELTNSPIVYINIIKNKAQAAFYVAKYVTKEPAQFGSMKRYWVSREYELHKEKPREKVKLDRNTTDIVRQRYAEVIYKRISQGWTVERLRTGWYRWWRPGAMTWPEITARQIEG